MDTSLFIIAFLIGGVAVFNPCGFALLPAYLSVLMSRTFKRQTYYKEESVSLIKPFLSVIRFSIGMTIGFLIIFTSFGFILTAGANIFASQAWLLPSLSFLIGVLLIVIGVSALFFGKILGLKNIAVQGIAPNGGFLTEIGYGATFALASLSCTIGPFLVVLGGLFADPTSIISNTNNIFIFSAYALGMGFVVFVLGLTMLILGGNGNWIRRHINIIFRTSGVLFILAGLYILLFTIVEIDILFSLSSNKESWGFVAELMPIFISLIDFIGVVQAKIVETFLAVGILGIISFCLFLIVVLILKVTLVNQKIKSEEKNSDH